MQGDVFSVLEPRRPENRHGILEKGSIVIVEYTAVIGANGMQMMETVRVARTFHACLPCTHTFFYAYSRRADV